MKPGRRSGRASYWWQTSDARYGEHLRSWEHLTIPGAAGQPFSDTSLFAAHAVCQLMRRHVTVALSGDGGDEGLGLPPLATGPSCRWQIVPPLFLRTMALACRPLSYTAMIPQHLPYLL